MFLSLTLDETRQKSGRKDPADGPKIFANTHLPGHTVGGNIGGGRNFSKDQPLRKPRPKGLFSFVGSFEAWLATKDQHSPSLTNVSVN